MINERNVQCRVFAMSGKEKTLIEREIKGREGKMVAMELGKNREGSNW